MVNILIRFLASCYLIIFRPSVRSAFPTRVSPYFILKLDRRIKDISLDKAFLGRDVKVSEGCRFFGDPIIFGNVEIGKFTSINGPATRVFGNVNGITIGSFCSIASNVVIQEYNHRFNSTTTYKIFSNILKTANAFECTSKGRIVISDDVWIGSQSVILSGVSIGRGSIIGAGSVVTKNVPPYSIVTGNPATILRKRFSQETIDQLESSEWWKWDVKKIRDNKDFFLKIWE